MLERVFTREDAKSIIRTNSEKVKLPADFTVIGRGALAGFSQMKELIIPEGVRRIESHAFFMRSFKDASNLEKLTIPASLTDFGQWCFFGCNRLTTITLPEDFPEQKALELFSHVPEATLNFGKKLLFAARSKTVQQVMDEVGGFLTLGSASLLQVQDGTLEIPKNYIGLTSHAMRSVMNKGVKRLVLLPSLRTIAPNAFSMLDMLEEVVFAEGTDHIDNYALCGCKRLKKITIPDSVKYIGAGAFMNLPSLESIRLPSELGEICDELFSGCTSLKKVIFGNKIRMIGPGAFYGCTALQTVMLPESIESIGNSTFWECTGLQRLYIPRGTKALSPSSLCNCPALTVLYMPRIVNDQLEAKRVFGDVTNPTITWLDDDVERPDWDLDEVLPDLSEIEEEIPEVPAELPVTPQAPQNASLQDTFGTGKKKAAPSAAAQQPAAGEPVDAERVRQLEETIASLRQQVAASGTAAAQSAVGTPVDAARVQHLEETIAALRQQVAQSGGAAASSGAPVDAERVRQLEETITALQKQVAETSAAGQSGGDAKMIAERAAMNSAAIAALNDNLASLQKKIEAAAALGDSAETISAMQEQVAAIASMQERVEEIAQQQETVQKQVGAMEEIREKVEAISAVPDIQDLAEAVTEVQEKVEAISEVQEKVEALSDMQEKVEALSDMQEKVEALSGMQEKVEALSDMQEKVEALSDMQEKVEALSDMQEKVEALSGVQEKVEAIAEVQSQVSAIPEIQKQVEELSATQQRMSAAVGTQQPGSPDTVQTLPTVTPAQTAPSDTGAVSPVQTAPPADSAEEPAPAVTEADPQTNAEQTPAAVPGKFDGTAFYTLRHGEYGPADKVFTYQISKPMPGPKERSAALKDYTVIAYRSFRTTEGGERFEIPEGVRRVETQGFWDCPRLLALELPISLTEVEPDAFSGCSRLTDVYLAEDFPDRLAVEYFLFRPEVKLHWPKKSMFSKARVATVAELMEQYDDILTPEKVKKLHVRSHILQIPEGYTVIAPNIGQYLDMRLDEPEHALKTIILPHSLRRIAAHAFTGMEAATHIVMREGLRIIDMNAFTGCMGPHRLVLPDSVTYIGPYAFAAPCRYEQIRLPRALKELPENAFTNCNSLVSLRIPETVEQIGEMALAGCTNLASLTVSRKFEEQLPAILDGPVKINVRWLEDQAESGYEMPSDALMSVLEQRFMPATDQRLFTYEMSSKCANFAERLSQLRLHPYIAPNALTEIANATKFEIPLGVLRICSYAFGTNTRLLTLTVPKALSEFEYAAFYGCEKLRDVFLPDDFDRETAAVLFMNRPKILLSFGNTRPVRVRQLTHDCPWVLSSGDSAELTIENGTITIPDRYLVIASYMYHGIMGLDDLKRIEIPASVRLIGSKAFCQLNDLEEIICAEGLRAVEPEAFEDCEKLRSIVLPSSLMFLGTHAFSGCSALETLVLPKRFADRETEIRCDAPHVNITWLEEAAPEPAPAQTKSAAETVGETIEEITAPAEESLPEVEVPETIPKVEQVADAVGETIKEITAPAEESLPEVEVPETIPEVEPVAETVGETIEEIAAPAEESLPEVDIPETIPEVEPVAETVGETIEEITAPVDETPAVSPVISLTDIDESMGSAIAAEPKQQTSEVSGISLTAIDQPGDTMYPTDSAKKGEEPEGLALDEIGELANALFGEGSEDAAEVLQEAIEAEIAEITETSSPSAAPAQQSEPVTADDAISAVADILFDVQQPETASPETPAEPQPEGTAVPAQPEESETPTRAMSQLADALFTEMPTESGGDSLTLPELTIPSHAALEETAEPPAPAPVIPDVPELSVPELTVPAPAAEISVPADGRLTTKERRKIYHKEAEFTIPAGYTDIRAGAFAGLDDLETIVLPDTIEKIGSGAFADCANLHTVSIPKSVKQIAEDAFDGCDALAEVTMPRAFEEMAEELFGSDVSITWLEEPAPQIIGDGRFTAKIRREIYDDEAELTIPEGYTEIRAGACAGLEELETVKLPSTLRKISSGAFADCTALVSIEIPAGVTDLEEDAFEGCTALKNVRVPAALAAEARVCFPDAQIELI